MVDEIVRLYPFVSFPYFSLQLLVDQQQQKHEDQHYKECDMQDISHLNFHEYDASTIDRSIKSIMMLVKIIFIRNIKNLYLQ